MEEFNGYDSFIFYRGWAETAKGFAEDFGEDFAKEMIWALVCYVCFGEIVTEKKSIIKWIEGDCLRVIEAAKKRHDASIEAGKLGGRPSKINKDDVLALKQDGKTVKEISEILGCSRDTVERALNECRKTAKPPQNLYVNEDDNENANNYTNEDENGVGSAEAEKSADAGKSASAETKLKVVQLFKRKYKYAQIQKETGLEFGEISSIINDKEHWSWWENEVKQDREEERSRRSREKQKIEENNMLKIVREHCEEPIDEKEVLEHYCSESMSEWYYSDLLSFFKINPNKKYTRFRDLSNDIQHDKDEAFKSCPY